VRRCADNTDTGGAVPPWWITFSIGSIPAKIYPKAASLNKSISTNNVIGKAFIFKQMGCDACGGQSDRITIKSSHQKTDTIAAK
jgi:hypothetical protein